MLRRSLRVALAFLAAHPLAACAGRAAEESASVSVAAVPLNPERPDQDRVGSLEYAGGLVLATAPGGRLHGLSDLAVFADGRFVAVTDFGDLVRARVVLDANGRLADLADVRISALLGLDGEPLRGKAEGDAEGLAMLPSGDMLVSFERHHRIWLYPADGGRPRAVAAPSASLPDNGGLEALAIDGSADPVTYLAGAEESGEIWRCHIGTSCTLERRLELGEGFGLVAIQALPQGRHAWLLRAYSARDGNTIVLRITDSTHRTVAEEIIQHPITRDNFEGLAAVPQADGGIRFYLLSDDNGRSTQRTLLMAFDWRP